MTERKTAELLLQLLNFADLSCCQVILWVKSHTHLHVFNCNEYYTLDCCKLWAVNINQTKVKVVKMGEHIVLEGTTVSLSRIFSSIVCNYYYYLFFVVLGKVINLKRRKMKASQLFSLFYSLPSFKRFSLSFIASAVTALCLCSAE